MRWTVTLAVELANLVAGRRVLAERLPSANLLPESVGGSQRMLTMTVSADSEAVAYSLAGEQVSAALAGLISDAPQLVSAFVDPD
jgi:hypothetical protein